MQDVAILLVEDDPGHMRLIEKNLRRANIKNEIAFATNGQEVLDYLFCEGGYADNHRPSHLLVLLHPNLPVLDGYQVLMRMKNDERPNASPWSPSPPPMTPGRWSGAMSSAATSTLPNRWITSSSPRRCASSDCF